MGINGAAAGAANGLTITSSGNKVMGLHVLNFTQDGIYIADGAANNIIGGDRAVGAGPNGQGLRVSGCGAYGIHMSGVTAGNNVVTGCWVGLDATGTAAQPNTAGILIENAASDNTVGGRSSTEANVISGTSSKA